MDRSGALQPTLSSVGELSARRFGAFSNMRIAFPNSLVSDPPVSHFFAK
jgi:hypothetical protein